MNTVTIVLLADTMEKLSRIHSQAAKAYDGESAIAFSDTTFNEYPEVLNDWLQIRTETSMPLFMWVITPWAQVKAGDLELLVEAMANEKAAIVHPAMTVSDYPHMRHSSGLPIKRVPYVDFVAPLIRVEAWLECKPEAMGPLWPLDWYYRLGKIGYYTYVYHGIEMPNVDFPVLEKDEASAMHYEGKYGPAWEDKLWPREG